MNDAFSQVRGGAEEGLASCKPHQHQDREDHGRDGLVDHKNGRIAKAGRGGISDYIVLIIYGLECIKKNYILLT